jgi:hypothetical protein
MMTSKVGKPWFDFAILTTIVEIGLLLGTDPNSVQNIGRCSKTTALKRSARKTPWVTYKIAHHLIMTPVIAVRVLLSFKRIPA